MYASSVDSRGLEETVDILGEVVLRPLFTQEEMDLSEQMIRFYIHILAIIYLLNIKVIKQFRYLKCKILN